MIMREARASVSELISLLDILEIAYWKEEEKREEGVDVMLSYRAISYT